MLASASIGQTIQSETALQPAFRWVGTPPSDAAFGFVLLLADWLVILPLMVDLAVLYLLVEESARSRSRLLQPRTGHFQQYKLSIRVKLPLRRFYFENKD